MSNRLGASHSRRPLRDWRNKKHNRVEGFRVFDIYDAKTIDVRCFALGTYASLSRVCPLEARYFFLRSVRERFTYFESFGFRPEISIVSCDRSFCNASRRKQLLVNVILPAHFFALGGYLTVRYDTRDTKTRHCLTRHTSYDYRPTGPVHATRLPHPATLVAPSPPPSTLHGSHACAFYLPHLRAVSFF